MNDLPQQDERDEFWRSQLDSTEPHRGTPPVVPELSQLIVHLLKRVLYREEDERLWASLMRLQARVREQAAVLLLDLVVDEAEGHAFLKSRPDPDESEASAEAYIGVADVKRSGRSQSESVPRLPRLVARRPLSYPVSLLLALLRKRMAEFDAAGGDTRLVLARDEIAELMRVFLPQGTNEARLVDQVDATIARVVDLGFLRRLKPAGSPVQDRGHYEVRRILKAYVDAQWLAEFDARLEVYRTALSAAAGAAQAGAANPEAGDA
jgi:hypothetical protein